MLCLKGFKFWPLFNSNKDYIVFGIEEGNMGPSSMPNVALIGEGGGHKCGTAEFPNLVKIVVVCRDFCVLKA